MKFEGNSSKPTTHRDSAKHAWDGKAPPDNILQVWSYVGQRLRDIRDHIDQAQAEFYDGDHNRLANLTKVNDALQTAIQVGKHEQPVCSYIDIEQLLKISPKSVVRPKLLTGAQDTLRPFLERLKDAIQKSDEGKILLEEHVVMQLEIFCSNYMKLNTPDDDYFQSLRAKTLKVRDHLRNFDRMALSLRDSTRPEPEWYCNDKFSLEVAQKFNCESVPVIRLVPDLIQKFEVVHLICSDWLRADKVYVENLEKQIAKSKMKIQELENKTKETTQRFDHKYKSLKRRKIELEEFDESYDQVWRDITQLEAKKTQLEIEIVTAIKALKNCKQLLEDLKNEPEVYDVIDSVAPDDDNDYMTAEDDEDEVDSAMQLASASYRSRLCRDIRGHTMRINYLKKKKKQLEYKLSAKRCMLQDIESNETEIQTITKSLRSITKKKSKQSEEVGVLKSSLEVLQQMLHYKQNPSARSRTYTMDKKQSRSRGSSFTRSRMDSFGRLRVDSIDRGRLDSFGRYRTRTNSFGPRNGSFGIRHGSISLRNGSFGQRTSSFTRIRSGSVTKAHNPKDVAGGLYMAKKRIADIQKAFRLVKNRIGMNWKDLARSLPYEPVKEIHEIDRDIKEIEYEHRGELKEQAYQALVRWYSHSGRNASVDMLMGTLKDINEVRLAEDLAYEVKGIREDKSSKALQEVKEESMAE